MGRENAVAKVIEIIEKVETSLADGYLFYRASREEIDNHLKETAEHIVNTVLMEVKK